MANNDSDSLVSTSVFIDMSQETTGFNFNSHDSNEDQNKNNIYLQIATPKSPNSDGFSPTEIHEDSSSFGNEIKKNVTNQIDIEILLKHREYNLVQNEMSKVQSQLDTLKNLHDEPKYAKYLQDMIDLKEGTKLDYQQQYHQYPNPFESEMVTRRQSIYGIRKCEDPYKQIPGQQQHRTSYGGLRPVVDSNGNKICVHKRSDGVIVKVECPTCARSDFGSAQGFLNHSRLAHQVEYKSQDHAALLCGTVMPDHEQEESGLNSLKRLKELDLDADRNLNPDCVNTSNAVNDDSNGQQKKKQRRSMSKPGTAGSSYLEKLFTKTSNNNINNPNNTKEDFKEIYQDATTKTDVEFDLEDDASSSPPISQDSSTAAATTTTDNSFKKGHNRRKSRGGLSAVTFEDQLESTEMETFTPKETTTTDCTLEQNANSSTVRFQEQHNTMAHVNLSSPSSEYLLTGEGLTPAQRRRVPTIANPLRTRSRSSRENSN